MVFNTGSTLLDAIVLAVVSKDPEGTYITFSGSRLSPEYIWQA